MDVLFVATELSPLVRPSGVADSIFSLTKALKGLGHRVTVAMPRFPAIERAGVLVARRLTPMALPASEGGKSVEVTLFDGRLASGVELLLFDAPGPDGQSLYGHVDSVGGADLYRDDGLAALRFGTLCRAAVEHVRARARSGQAYDVVHAHDWAAAPVAYLVAQHPELAAVRTVLTLHDAAEKGHFGREALAALGLGAEHFTPEALEFYGGVSFLKGGMLAAHALTTSSPAVARALVTPDAGHRLDGVVRARAGRFAGREPALGITDGVDYAIDNPATDPSLAARYDSDDPSNKGRAKSALCKEHGLEIAPERPLFVVAGRLDREHGLDALVEAAPKLLKQELTLVVAGEGDAGLLDRLREAFDRAPERARLLTPPALCAPMHCTPERGLTDDATLHRLLAAADFVLFPHRREPSVVGPLRAQRYGAIPVVARNGGLADAVVDVDVELETGTGLAFDEVSAAHLSGAVGRALTAWEHPRFAHLVRRVMRLDLGWERPARRYVQLYRSLGTAAAGA